MRSPNEIRFRLRQEAANLVMFAKPPVMRRRLEKSAQLLPDAVRVAAALRSTSYAQEVLSIAQSIMAHRLPLMGFTVETGSPIEWRRDYIHGITTGTTYSRRFPYLDFSRVGDHKVVWELNRHQHLPLLAQAFLLTGRRDFLNEAFLHVETWMDQNPFLRGINWASALEVAFRALSWIWLWHLAAGEMPEPLRRRFLKGLYQHGCFLEQNLSIYFSPNTHLLGEAVALHALGAIFPSFPRAAGWADTGGRMVQQEIERQVRPDGSHFEQSAYYHLYALDLFLLHHVLAQPSDEYTASLVRMAEYLHALMGPSGLLPMIGDDDGGRLFHPYGERARFGCGTLATCAARLGRAEWLRAAEDLHCQAAWWLGDQVIESEPSAIKSAPEAAVAPPIGSQMFADAGVAVMAAGEAQIVLKAGPFAEGSAGHSHADVLSMVARLGAREVLIDPGTFTYVADPEERNRFRGVGAHSTLRIDGRDQAVPAGPFRWEEKPATAVREWASSLDRDLLDASCTYGGFTHRRRVQYLKRYVVVVLDTVDGPAGEHTIEQLWHLAGPQDAERLSFSAPAETVEGWRSRVFGTKEPAPVLRVVNRGGLPARMAMVLDLSRAPATGAVQLHPEGESIIVSWGSIRVTF